VLQGISATAPYLHNGSVPTLADLLKPANQRPAAFQIGPAYDTVNVGLAADQTMFNYNLKTTDCNDRNSGNSRCGHEFGTQLSPAEKRALLEYLKAL
jgi:cytochrome c peroxidase